MSPAEFKVFAAQIAALWPQTAWEPATIEVAQPAFIDLPTPVLKRVLADLFREGREFAPSPSTVYARAAALNAPLALPPADPELLREPTPEEQAAAQRWRPLLQEAIADLARRKTLGAENAA